MHIPRKTVSIEFKGSRVPPKLALTISGRLHHSNGQKSHFSAPLLLSSLRDFVLAETDMNYAQNEKKQFVIK